MTRFGFDTNPVKLPDLPAKKPKAPDRGEIAEVARAGRELGFVPRETPRPPTTRSRKRRREQRGNLLIHGPERILVRFRSYADGADLSYWEALEQLLDRKG